MSSDSAWGIEPPKDAEGKVIPLDTEVLYDKYENVFHVVDFRYSPKEREWRASGGFTGPKDSWCLDTNRLLLAPTDSWEKLEEEVRNAAEKDIAPCAYLSPDGKGCTKCQAKATRACTRTAFADIADRIERLMGASND